MCERILEEKSPAQSDQSATQKAKKLPETFKVLQHISAVTREKFHSIPACGH
jgi:hypothetical protein